MSPGAGWGWHQGSEAPSSNCTGGSPVPSAVVLSERGAGALGLRGVGAEAVRGSQLGTAGAQGRTLDSLLLRGAETGDQRGADPGGRIPDQKGEPTPSGQGLSLIHI